jgi:lipopolysaccharide heptosyltransferase II
MPGGMSAAGWAAARRVLAVRLDGMGDMLMTTPALRALKDALPGRELTVLTSPAGAEVARLLPFVDHVMAFAAPWMKHPALAHAAARTTALVGELRARRFDAAVVFTVFSQSPLPAALALMLAGVPLRAAHCRENPYDLLTDWIAEQDLDVRAGVRHEVRRQLDLVAALGVPVQDTRLQLALPADAQVTARQRLAAAGIDAQAPYIAVHPGATAPSRRYPVAQLAQAVATLAHDGARVVALGAREDREAAAALVAAGASASLAGELSLPELAAALAGAQVVVANNSLAAHLAAAVGTPVCDLYALTNPQHTPWQVLHRVLNHDVDCRYCFKSVCPERHHRCLAAVAPAEVVAAVRELAAQRVDPARAAAAGRASLSLAA